jgi:hypothetical protein
MAARSASGVPVFYGRGRGACAGATHWEGIFRQESRMDVVAPDDLFPLNLRSFGHFSAKRGK